MVADQYIRMIDGLFILNVVGDVDRCDYGAALEKLTLVLECPANDNHRLRFEGAIPAIMEAIHRTDRRRKPVLRAVELKRARFAVVFCAASNSSASPENTMVAATFRIPAFRCSSWESRSFGWYL